MWERNQGYGWSKKGASNSSKRGKNVQSAEKKIIEKNFSSENNVDA